MSASAINVEKDVGELGSVRSSTITPPPTFTAAVPSADVAASSARQAVENSNPFWRRKKANNGGKDLGDADNGKIVSDAAPCAVPLIEEPKAVPFVQLFRFVTVHSALFF